MKYILFTILLLNATFSGAQEPNNNSQDYPAFHAITQKYRCVDDSEFENICILFVENDELDEKAHLKYVAIIFDDGFDYLMGDFIHKDTALWVNLDYTDKVDNPRTLATVKRKYGKKYTYYQLLKSSPGGYEDVVDILYRD